MWGSMGTWTWLYEEPQSHVPYSTAWWRSTQWHGQSEPSYCVLKPPKGTLNIWLLGACQLRTGQHHRWCRKGRNTLEHECQLHSTLCHVLVGCRYGWPPGLWKSCCCSSDTSGHTARIHPYWPSSIRSKMQILAPDIPEQKGDLGVACSYNPCSIGRHPIVIPESLMVFCRERSS